MPANYGTYSTSQRAGRLQYCTLYVHGYLYVGNKVHFTLIMEGHESKSHMGYSNRSAWIIQSQPKRYSVVELENVILCARCSNPILFTLVSVFTLTYLGVFLRSEKERPGLAQIWLIYMHALVYVHATIINLGFFPQDLVESDNTYPTSCYV